MNIAAYALLIFALAVLIEGSVEYFLGTVFVKLPKLTPYSWVLMYVSLLLGVGVSFFYALDVIALIATQAQLPMTPTWVGEVATGILIGRAPGTPWPFDSPSPAFWSEAENCYVAFVRTWSLNEPLQADPEWNKKYQRRVSWATSTDFITWTPLVDTGANLPGEQLYTNQTHPYFRAPHIYIATMMRFTQGMERGEPVEGNNGSSDVLLMTMRAGATSYQRSFREAFIRPGLDPRMLGAKGEFRHAECGAPRAGRGVDLSRQRGSLHPEN